MATQLYSTVASRNLLYAAQKMLKHAEPIQVLGSFGMQHQHPKNKTDTVVFRRLKPFNASASEVPSITPAALAISEGTTPTANTIDYTDVSVTLKQYGVLFKFSDKVADMYEDNIPDDAITQTTETMIECTELIAYGQLKAGSNVIYSNGTTRAGVNTALDGDDLRRAARTLMSNRGKKVTKKIASGPNYDTSAVEPSFVVFHSTDCNSDVRDLPGFVPVVKYGSAMTKVHENEIGAWEEFRFVPSPLFAPTLAGGSATLNGMLSAGSSNVDIYHYVVIAEDCLGHISLKGKGYSAINPTLVPPGDKNAANPLGLFGYVGASFWYACKRLNENWMIRIEAGASSLA